MRTDDPYQLLGVPRDASTERVRMAYELEVTRAHRAGATAHAVALSGAYDTLSDPARRALYDRHGLAPVRERSPGAVAPATPWRHEKQRPLPSPSPARRSWRAPTLAVFCFGIVAGLILAVYVQRQANKADVGGNLVPQQSEHQVQCDTTPTGQGYIYSEPVSNPPHCANGAAPRVLG